MSIFWMLCVAAVVVFFATRRKSESLPATVNSRGPMSALCSGCYQVTPLKNTLVLPWWNEGEANYLTSYRCQACSPKSLAETRASIEVLDEDRKEKFADFVQRHQEKELARAIRAKSCTEAKSLLHQYVDGVESGAIKLRP